MEFWMFFCGEGSVSVVGRFGFWVVLGLDLGLSGGGWFWICSGGCCGEWSRSGIGR